VFSSNVVSVSHAIFDRIGPVCGLCGHILIGNTAPHYVAERVDDYCN